MRNEQKEAFTGNAVKPFLFLEEIMKGKYKQIIKSGMIVVLMILTCGSFSVSAKENQGFHFEQINMNENAESYEAVLTDGKGNLWQIISEYKEAGGSCSEIRKRGD